MSIKVAYDEDVRTAVKAFWGNRIAAVQKQVESGTVDQGERAGVTAGKNLDGFVELLCDVVRDNGLHGATIHVGRTLPTLPGYFRPTKTWDVLVLYRSRLVAAIELKSHVGPSFGNNCNNRAEEAIGSAVDFQTAFREGAFGEQSRPFVGWMMLVEDCPGSRKRVRAYSPHFDVFPEFKGASYAERYNVLCRKLVQEQLYSAATVLLSPRTAITSGDYSELSPLTGLRTFIATLAGHVAAEAEMIT